MIDILWDEAHLWGYLARHAVEAAGLPHRLLKGSEIAQGGLWGKPGLRPYVFTWNGAAIIWAFAAGRDWLCPEAWACAPGAGRP